MTLWQFILKGALTLSTIIGAVFLFIIVIVVIQDEIHKFKQRWNGRRTWKQFWKDHKKKHEEYLCRKGKCLWDYGVQENQFVVRVCERCERREVWRHHKEWDYIWPRPSGDASRGYFFVTGRTIDEEE